MRVKWTRWKPLVRWSGERAAKCRTSPVGMSFRQTFISDPHSLFCWPPDNWVAPLWEHGPFGTAPYLHPAGDGLLEHGEGDAAVHEKGIVKSVDIGSLSESFFCVPEPALNVPRHEPRVVLWLSSCSGYCR